MITLIAAVGKNNAIGKDGAIPWCIPEDLEFFKQETIGGFLIMGRKTWESLPSKLPNRVNCVLSSKHVEGADISCTSLDEALTLSKKYTRIYGIGGEEVYRKMMPIANRILITDVDVEVEGADTFFPGIEYGFECVKWFDLDTDPECTVCEYLRKNVVRALT